MNLMSATQRVHALINTFNPFNTEHDVSLRFGDIRINTENVSTIVSTNSFRGHYFIILEMQFDRHMTINFYLRPRTRREDYSVQAVIRWNRRKIALNTSQTVTKKDWNQADQRVRKTDRSYNAKNARLNDFEQRVKSLFDQFTLTNGFEPSLEEFRELLNPKKAEKVQIRYGLVWDVSKNIVFTCFLKTQHDSTKWLGAESKI